MAGILKLRYISFALGVVALVDFAPSKASACTGSVPNCAAQHGQCWGAYCNALDNTWECLPKPSGTACNDNNACTTGDHCDGNGYCVGTLVCPPGTPGPISGPSNSSTGSYTLSWGASSGVLDHYELYENGAGIFNTTGLTASIGGRGTGSYTYTVRGCNSVGCSAFTAGLTVTVLLPPGPPGGISAPSETGPSYRVSWGAASGTIDHYDLGESVDNGTTWSANATLTTTYQDFSGKPYGTYTYRARACNASGCSSYVIGSVRVTVITGLSAFPDSPVVAPSVPVPAQAWVGTLPGTPAVEGGVATYRIPIEIPPGRNGMQPEVALSYSSRNGKGIAGVGWALSATRNIYRCPQTLAQDGAGRTIQQDGGDRLCFDGQRLVLNAGSYGASWSEYRTEIDQFDRITLKSGDISVWSSYFEVEHKSGRISQFEPGPSLGSTSPPDTWYLAREFDRQGNCIAYNYTTWYSRGADQDRELASIVYTGSGSRSGNTFAPQCSTSADARTVSFQYEDRPDRRTTYRYGVATIANARLISISTMVGQQTIRSYHLSYHASGATQRSLLDNVVVCAGSSCGAVQLPPTRFTYEEDGPNFDFYHVQRSGDAAPLTQDWRLLFVPDLDGDGTRDMVYAQDLGERDLQLSTGGMQYHIENSQFWTGFDKPLDNTLVGGAVDMNNDGRADMLGVDGGVLAFANLNSLGSAVQWNVTTTDFPMPVPADGGVSNSAGGIDYDGDGLVDVLYVDANGVQTVSLHRNRDPAKWANAAGITNSVSVAVPVSQGQLTRDLNGDGLVDTVLADNPFSTSDPTQVIFFQYNKTSTPQYTFTPQYLLSALGSPNNSTYSIAGSFLQYKWRRWIDVNGDGLPDIYDPPTSVWINRGGPPGTAIFQRMPLTMPSLDTKRTVRAFVMDVDNDGRDELMVPNARQIDYCYNDPTHKLPSGEPIYFCGADFDTTASPYPDYDRSVFSWTAYKFLEGADGSYTMTPVPTNLWAPTNYPLLQNDSNGDGTTDVYFRLSNSTVASVSKYYNGFSALGPYISRNFVRAPDLMLSASNGLGAIATWKHRPLSDHSSLTNTTIGCDMPEPFYQTHLDDPRSQDYAFFTSSMWTVARFDISNGVGGGMNKICYRYQDAMLNAAGRGFQGFKKIVAEEQMPPAAGEPASSIPGCGVTCSVNNRRTTSDFFQEFPFTNRLSKVTVAQLTTTGAQKLSDTTYWWDVQPHSTATGAYVVIGTGTVDKGYETSGALVRQKTTIVQVNQASGETSVQCIASSGQAADSAHDVIVTDTRTYDETVLSAWWPTKLISRTVVTDFGGGIAVDGTCQLSGASKYLPSWSCSRATPICPTASPTSSAKTQTTNYFWYADNTGGSSRQLNHQDIVFQSATEASTAFQYDPFGNVNWKQVTARDVANDATYPPTNTGSVTLPAAAYLFSSDNYFVTTETNPLGHMASTTTDPATGLPTYHQAVQGGPATRMVYDPFGRLQTTTIDGQQPIEQRLSSCGVGDCAIKRQVFQSGSPIKSDYLDMLGRAIATGVEGFDGKEILAKVDYNSRGAKVAEHQPINTTLPPGSWNGALASNFMTQYSGIDALGRPATKTVVRSSAPDLFEPGKGSANLITSYAYTYDSTIPGLKTSITVSTPTTAAGQITMSRSYDPRGRLIQTVQQVTSPSSHAITTNYVWDPSGSLTDIIDSAQHDLKATYDNLGRKIRVDDPDRSTWLYSWDGLGRVRSQKDARGTSLYYQYDAVGRMERRFVQATPSSSILLEANWQYDLNGKPGTLSSLLGVIDGFRKDYKYDALFRPWTMITTIPSAPSSGGAWTARQFNVEYGYDHNYGRVKAIGFPSTTQGAIGEIARFDYKDPQGYSRGETPLDANGNPNPSGAFYRQILSTSVRGQIADQLFGNNVEETLDYDDSTGMPLWITATGLREAPPSRCATASASLVRQLTYKYDHFLNVARQEKTLYQRDTNGAIMFDASCATINELVKETYQYDELQRLLSASRSGSIPSVADSYAYDDLGNITSKSDKADTYKYESSKPHAVTSLWNAGAQLTSYVYDPNGNMLSGDGRTLSFDSLDRPATVTTTGTTYFAYAPDGSRYAQSGPTGTEYYVDKMYEYIVYAGGSSEQRTHVSDAVSVVRAGSSRGVKYRDLDRLGSLEAATTDAATEDLAYGHGYDAFGKPRSRDWLPNGDKMYQSFERGFTGHEHLDNLYLIHMNGRVYDYRLGRFLSVDPIISNPADSQSINPYSYIGNNPLSGVDPTGYAKDCNSYSYGPCETIWFNPPQGKQTVNILVMENGGRATYYPNVPLNTPISDLLGPPDTGKQAASSGTGAPSGAEPGALALNNGALQKILEQMNSPAGKTLLTACATDPVCAVPVGIGLLGLGAWWAYDHWGTPTPVATDATGALKPGEEGPIKPGEQVVAEAPTPQPEAGGAGAMSRGPGSPGSLSRQGAEEIPILRDAARGHGNFGLGAADNETTMRLGQAWVGPGARTASDGRTLVSDDGLRQFRPPSWKPALGRLQANFEWRTETRGPWVGNGHLDIQFGPGAP